MDLLECYSGDEDESSENFEHNGIIQLDNAEEYSSESENEQDSEETEKSTVGNKSKKNVEHQLPSVDYLLKQAPTTFKQNKRPLEDNADTVNESQNSKSSNPSNNTKQVQEKPKVVTREKFQQLQQERQQLQQSLAMNGRNDNKNSVGNDKVKAKNKAEDKSAKDRVKRQRLQGQSGIGEDFKTWRSEEEMRIRQQFD